jgi:hypothetical protein
MGRCGFKRVRRRSTAKIDPVMRCAAFFVFTRGSDSLQRPVPVDPHSEPWRGSLMIAS